MIDPIRFMKIQVLMMGIIFLAYLITSENTMEPRILLLIANISLSNLCWLLLITFYGGMVGVDPR